MIAAVLAALSHLSVAFGDLARYADPFVGTAGTGHTTPAACVPFGLVQAGADTGFGDWPHCGGYIYGDGTICGFTQTHVNGTGCPDLGDLRLVPFRGERPEAIPFDHADETASPGCYAVDLKAVGVRVEVAAAEHAAIYRFTAERDGTLKLLIEDKGLFFNPPEFPKRPETRLSRDIVTDADGRAVGVRGAYRARCWVERTVAYDVAFGRAGRDVGADAFAFDLKAGETLFVKIGLSAGGVADARPERAQANLTAEIPDWDFDGVKAAARQKWNDALGAATIEGSEEQKKNWYTSLYHLFIQPSNIADVGEKPFYSTFSCWDTFRAAGPLYTLLCPNRAAEFVDSMLEQGRRTGWLPIWTLWGKDNQCMIGTHSIPMIVDWFLKRGVVGSRSRTMEVKNSIVGLEPTTTAKYWQSAYAQIKETLTKRHEGRRKENWDLYDRYGYYPFDRIRGESVSRTMECAYDDWCAGKMAERLGHKEDAAFFFRRAASWKNVFDPSIGLVRGKDSKGNWRTPYDPYALGHGADLDNDFTEGNAFQYSWHVMQDVPGLVAAMGGREKFVRNLDALFTAPVKTSGEGLVVDVTGLIGQYVHGNEPSHHVIYFYPQVGEPAKAAERIREVFDRFYLPKPDGLCGNDDCGQMSAWYLFSAMGFYPFNPCGGEYVIGAPQVEKVTLRVCSPSSKSESENGIANIHSTTTTSDYNSFTVIAKNLSKENKYVKSVMLNGKPVTDWKIRHADILAGGELAFEMTDKKEKAK